MPLLLLTGSLGVTAAFLDFCGAPRHQQLVSHLALVNAGTYLLIAAVGALSGGAPSPSPWSWSRENCSDLSFFGTPSFCISEYTAACAVRVLSVSPSTRVTTGA